MKSEAQKTRIIAKKIAGKSNREIAREEGINRETVGRILNGSQYQAVMRAFREEVLNLVPKSIAHYNRVLDQANRADEDPVVTFGKEQIVSGAQANQEIQRAYQRGFKAGLDATKVASDVLHGTQVFVTKQDHTVYDDPGDQISDTELDSRIIAGLERLAGKSAPRGA